MSQLYLVKDKKGRIFGPYTEEEICFHIEEGELKGNEQFSNYPTGKWQPLSASSVFYKKIISKLNRVEKTTQSNDELSNLSDNVTSEEQETLEPTRILKVDLKESPSKKKKVKIKLSREFRDEVLKEEGFDDVIDMEPLADKKNIFSKKLLRYSLFAGSAFLLLLILVLNPSGEKTDKLKPERLLAPYKTRSKIKKEQLKDQFKTAFAFYKKASIPNYLKAQKIYVELLESFPKESSLYPLLCLVHLEIWPFSYQDTKDKQSLQRVLNLVQKEDQSKKNARFCLAVNFYIKKDFQAVIKLTNDLLNQSENIVNPAFIFYLQAQALKNSKSEKKALSLLDTAIKLEPKWIAPRLLKANIYYQNQQYNPAIREYQKILKTYPDHISALIRLGILEYKHLKQIKKSQSTLIKAFSQKSQKTAPDILFDAYLILANIYYNQGKKKELLNHTKKAYALRPDSADVIKLKNQINNKKAFEKIRVESRALIYKGDLLVDQENCLKAIKHFTEAYKFTRSGLAAFKTGQCYWKLGATGQSIRWLKRAVNVEPNLLDAHLTLSDYLSQLYQFDYARDILNSVIRRYPNNPDVYKAYSKVAFRSEFYNQAIAYGGRVLSFYPHDITTLVLLSRSHFALEEVNLAHSYAKKAINQNPNDSSAQISYALILDHTAGDIDTVTHLRNKIEEHPQNFEYHQALGEHFYNQEQYDKAREELELLAAKNPKLKSVYILLGLTYTELSLKNKKYFEIAIKNFREAALLDLSDVKPAFYVGQIHLNNGSYDLAHKEFNKVIQVNPNYPLIHYYFGLSILKKGGAESLDQALKAAQTEAVKNPEHYLPYKLAGDVYRLKSTQSFNKELNRKKMYSLCAKEYQKALKYAERSIEISMNLLLCYKGSGNIDKGLELANNLIKEDGLSGYPDVYREIGVIFEFKEEYEKARDNYNKYFQLKPSAKDRVEIERRISSLMEQKKKLTQPEEK